MSVAHQQVALGLLETAVLRMTLDGVREIVTAGT